ncbi:hypothetical protein MNBD_PLANCTO03-184, partial [hydrothermal vent metagenome]
MEQSVDATGALVRRGILQRIAADAIVLTRDKNHGGRTDTGPLLRVMACASEDTAVTKFECAVDFQDTENAERAVK